MWIELPANKRWFPWQLIGIEVFHMKIDSFWIIWLPLITTFARSMSIYLYIYFSLIWNFNLIYYGCHGNQGKSAKIGQNDTKFKTARSYGHFLQDFSLQVNCLDEVAQEILPTYFPADGQCWFEFAGIHPTTQMDLLLCSNRNKCIGPCFFSDFKYTYYKMLGDMWQQDGIISANILPSNFTQVRNIMSLLNGSHLLNTVYMFHNHCQSINVEVGHNHYRCILWLWSWDCIEFHMIVGRCFYIYSI